jgi:hypothetical protein
MKSFLNIKVMNINMKIEDPIKNINIIELQIWVSVFVLAIERSFEVL